MIKKQSEIIKERRKNSVMLLRRKKGRIVGKMIGKLVLLKL